MIVKDERSTRETSRLERELGRLSFTSSTSSVTIVSLSSGLEQSVDNVEFSPSARRGQHHLETPEIPTSRRELREGRVS